MMVNLQSTFPPFIFCFTHPIVFWELMLSVFYYIISKMVFLKDEKNPVTLPLWIAMLIRKLRVRRKLLKQAKHALYSVAQWVEITSEVGFVFLCQFFLRFYVSFKGCTIFLKKLGAIQTHCLQIVIILLKLRGPIIKFKGTEA